MDLLRNTKVLAAGTNGRKQSHRQYEAASKKSFLPVFCDSFYTSSCYFNGIWAIPYLLLLHYNHELREINQRREQVQSISMLIPEHIGGNDNKYHIARTST